MLVYHSSQYELYLGYLLDRFSFLGVQGSFRRPALAVSDSRRGYGKPISSETPPITALNAGDDMTTKTVKSKIDPLLMVLTL